MNTFEGRRIVLVIGLAIAFLASGCGTLTVETEPDLVETQVEPAQSDPALSEPDGLEPTPTLTIKEVDEVVTEVAILGATEVEEEATAAPLAGMLDYTNSDYGFSLSYPTEWSLAEVNDADFLAPGSRSVQLSQGTVTLVIGYRRAGEQVPIGGSGVPAGDVEVRGTVQVAGQEVDRYVIVYEGKDKVVMYGQPGTPIFADSLELSIRMDDFAPGAYEDVDLSQSLQSEADAIVGSLAVIEPEGNNDAAVNTYNYSDWQPYSNESLGYSLMVPNQADVMGANPNGAVEFVGPIVGDDHWPWFSIQHFDSGFFRPPVGTDVRQWLADSNIPYEPVDQEMTIGGLPAVHYAIEASPQAYGRDEYYVIHDGQLFQITLLHAGGNEDWALYEQFLDCITFAEGL